MASGDDKTEKPHAGAPRAAGGDGGRSERLAAALRQNLQRRKAQARARRASSVETGSGAPASAATQPAKDS